MCTYGELQELLVGFIAVHVTGSYEVMTLLSCSFCAFNALLPCPIQGALPASSID